MPDIAVISEILDEILDSGRTPEEVCPHDPELLAEVHRRLRQFRQVEAQIDDLFPSSDAKSSGAERIHLTHLNGKMPDIPGYEVESILGHGGMGVVYKARHLKLNRTVAIKMLLAGVYASATERTRFLREAEAVARLSHPNVVQLFDMGECDGFPYFTMEFIEGGTLAQKLNGSPWPLHQTPPLIRTLALAVQAAHQAGIVHRDLKPGNILLTSDGTPKISDFGLARRVDEDVHMTLSGARVGTPCYMAPEQALGQTSNIGPATDVYALGAILYELLTGRPPFRGETTPETQRQVISQEPVRPARLNPNVRRDLETICLTCLRKEPNRRYVSAAAFADDLDRFMRDEPIAARRTSLVERSAKWVRRHPSLTVAAIALLLLLLVSIASAVWSAVQRANLADAVNGNLNAMTTLMQDERWGEARAALGRAQAILVSGGTDQLRQRCDQAVKDLDLATALDKTRLTRETNGLLVVYRQMANDEYARLFSQAHLGTFHDLPKDVAARVNASPERTQLLAVLDEWAYSVSDPTQRDWVLQVALAAAPDPGGWSQRILDPSIWSNADALTALADEVPVDQVSLPLLLALGENLLANGKDPALFLSRVQAQHADDFWANLVLGDALFIQSPAEARGYYRIALAQRLDAPVGYCNIGDTYRMQQQYSDAIRYYRKAIDLDPNYARAYSNIGLSFEDEGNYEGAISYFNKALHLDRKYAWSYVDLGTTLELQGKPDEAAGAFQKAMALEPNNPLILNSIRSRFQHKGAASTSIDAWTKWHEFTETNPTSFEDWWGYPELTLFLGKQAEYRRARTEILKLFGNTVDPNWSEKIGRACLMLPGNVDETRAAATLIDRAVASENRVDPWLYPYFLFAKGLADYRQAQFGPAIAILQNNAPDGLGPSPRLVLAMALYHQGKQREARKVLASAVTSYADWHPAASTKRDLWMTNILCREAENTILPDIPAFLQGKYQPRDNDERLALVAVCEDNALNATEAQLLADSFVSDPTLTVDMHNGLRARAACAAARAGVGNGKDSDKLNDAARAYWRDQARRWLQSDLEAARALLKQNHHANSDFVTAVLRGWETNRDLAGIRNKASILQLPAAERTACDNLWTQVQATLDSLPANVRNATLTEREPIQLPFKIYKADLANPPFSWSGWMGERGLISLDLHCTDNPHSGTMCMKLQFKSNGYGGIAAQYPPNNWGDKPDGYNLTGATRLTFWARGQDGGEDITFRFGILEPTVKYPDSDHAELNDVLLTKNWKQYTIDLAGKNLTSIKTGFVWESSTNDKPVTFYLDDIQYE